MTTPEQLEELKAKYPLAFDTIKWPVRYDNQVIRDAEDWAFAEVNILQIPYVFQKEKSQDQIGELICHLLNQLQ